MKRMSVTIIATGICSECRFAGEASYTSRSDEQGANIRLDTEQLVETAEI